MKTDMNPQAITRRLRQTSELRRLCLKLGRNSFIKLKKSSKGKLKHGSFGFENK